MNLARHIASYRRLRNEPFWKLLAADNGPIALALLQNNLMEGDRRLPASVLYERLSDDIDQLRANGEDLPQTPQAYVMNWLTNGWLTRKFLAGASEEEFELSTEAAHAVRLITSLIEPRSVTTESRLSTVIHQLVTLAEATDPDPQSRLMALQTQRDRIDREIEAVKQGHMTTMPNERALEQVREIIVLAGELVADFHNVRDHFDQLNRGLRERIMEESDSRADVLKDLFAGIDVIAQSDSGRTFYAFWRLLTDPEQNAILEESVDSIFNRDFSEQLNIKERRFLQSLVRTLINQGGMVHDVLQHFARSLRQFVESREYMEQRLIHQRIREAQRAALEAREAVGLHCKLETELELTSSRIRSLSQWVLYDPSTNAIEKGMAHGDGIAIDLESISGLVAHSEIDFRTLQNHIRSCLKDVSQVTIGDILNRYPAEQGLGSVVGYIVLGTKIGMRVGENNESIDWTGEDGICRHARIPTIFFLRERIDELE